ncbi:anti-sigma factor [Nevskia sp.]|uniref:anti-sigma factor n=1 Tax=Nevskia sp. TaxID=1929292 RepID=UPI0025F903C3|nr:anti-sigma factor [Nevskia sp.]
MKYDNLKLRQMLAAEYVLGTLRGGARRRFERLARGDIAIRSEIRFWESRLAGLAAGMEPKSPPPSVWFSLQHRIETSTPVVTPMRRPVPPPQPVRKADVSAPASPWRIVAGLATAAAVVVAVLIGTRVPLPGQPAAPVVAAAPVVTPAAVPPIYVSLLQLPESNMQWTLAVRPMADEVTAVASGAYPKLGEHSLELWLITDAGAVSLGLLPTAGEGKLKLPSGVSGAQLTLAVSLEPVGGSPTGQPTGPVLTSGPAIKAV